MEQEKKLKAVDYDRVSTEEEKQLNALERQIQENRDTIKEMGWDHVDSYVDEGKSGTKVKGRDEYKRLYDDLLTDKFDVVCIKDQDRLMRSTKDWYLFVDRLVTQGKLLYMYLDRSWYTPDNSLITGVKAIMAEEYSRNLSKKINNSNRRRVERAQKGEKLSLYSNGICYGWDFINGEYVINKEEAKIKLLAGNLYLEGNGLRNIRRILTAKGYHNREGREFNEVTIRNMITDPKNIGTVVTNKTHYDFERKKTVKNPESEWVYFPNRVPPIYTEEMYTQILDILEARVDKAGCRGRKTGDHPLSGKIFCGECDKVYWKYERRTKDPSLFWKCSTYCRDGRKTNRKKGGNDLGLRDASKGCDAPNVNNEFIMTVLTQIADDLVVVNKAVVKKEILEWLNSLIRSLKGINPNKSTLEEIRKQERRKDKLTEAYLEEIVSKEDYKKKYKEIEDRIGLLKLELPPEDADEEVLEIKKVIDNIDTELEEWIGTDDFNSNRLEFLIQHIKRITVSGEHMVIELDLIAGAIIAGKDFLQYVQGRGEHFIHTEKVYSLPTAEGELTVKFMLVA